MSNVIERFGKLAIKRGGTLFFEPNNALAVIIALEMDGITVLGIDAFLITESSTQPLMEKNADFSSKEENSWNISKKFLRDSINSGLLYEIIVDD